jgi:hypothetical protein
VACKRNLYFYIYPRKNSYNKPTPWRWNVYRLLAHLDVFNGRRIVVVATDEATESEDAVKAEFPSDGHFEFVSVQNHKVIGETAPFLGILEKLQSKDPNELTFYAHAKGVAKAAHEVPAVQAWANMMYEMNLSYPDQIDMLMRRFGSVGCMRISRDVAPAAYIFGGNYFWMNHSAVFSGPWKRIVEHYYGAERYIGMHVPLELSFSLTQEISINLYQVKFPAAVLHRWLERLSRLSPEDVKGRNDVPWTF